MLGSLRAQNLIQLAALAHSSHDVAAADQLPVHVQVPAAGEPDSDTDVEGGEQLMAPAHPDLPITIGRVSVHYA